MIIKYCDIEYFSKNYKNRIHKYFINFQDL